MIRELGIVRGVYGYEFPSLVVVGAAGWASKATGAVAMLRCRLKYAKHAPGFSLSFDRGSVGTYLGLPPEIKNPSLKVMNTKSHKCNKDDVDVTNYVVFTFNIRNILVLVGKCGLMGYDDDFISTSPMVYEFCMRNWFSFNSLS